MKTDFKRVYIGYTVYSLYLYLLYSTEEEINNTFFFFGEGIDKRIRDKFENQYFFNDAMYERKNTFSRLLYRIRLRHQSHQIWPFLKDAQIFAQDQFFFCAALIAKRNYTLVEDAPNVFLRHRGSMNKQRKTFLHIVYVFKKIFHKYIENSFSGEMGENAQCTSFLMTNIESDPILKGKELIQVVETEYWDKAPETKRNQILVVFSITAEDLAQLKKRKVIVFTQNFASLGFLPEQELVDIYAERIAKYPLEDIVIKKHAFDWIDYRKYFPDAYVFDKIVPMQLVNLLGIRYRTAITICSSAVLSFPYDIRIENSIRRSFPYDIRIDWIGTEGNPKLFAALGKHELEAYMNKT